MGIDRKCRWARRRLPLLAGGDLLVDERRKVERHLIGCPDCRDRRDASEGALSALRAIASEPTARPDAPPLWPELARQIRQSRHVPPRPAWWPLPRLAPGPWPAAGLALGLGALMAASLSFGRAGSSPIAPTPVAVRSVAVVPPAPDPEPDPPPAHRGALPGGLAQAVVKPIEPPSAFRFDYDLELGTPMDPGSRDPQRSY